ncbi:MAG TPA: hypothetical protein DHV08_14805 [Rhodocyclaceae bacterium]|nr:MAG: hypothetical protein AUK49_08805 [Betaproteobacteria bacterium CG2_30_68_42]PIV74294.1 MAG: hypothetical protein COW56_05190 [Rhodocyclales bacterium CG17_big_fil_post_rev_8_21_14_2_50_68_7]PJA58498.1 MAG: hypothetical protein CO164_02190 [Rhodocyclales bacterium CG_4_9_14_3_um_filter_68_10]HCX34685.1 hypothetical protein [Rhodocyclaceae bacterium]
MTTSPEKTSRTRAMRRGVWPALLLVAAALVLAAVFWPPQLSFLAELDAGAFAQRIRSWGRWAAAGSIALMVAHSFVPFPAEILTSVNGMVFGAVWGTVITWTGAMLGACLAFALARRLGRPFVEHFVPAPELDRADTWTDEHGAKALLIARLVPLIAFNLINYAAGLTTVRWRTFLWTTALGILPLTIALTTFGEHLLELPAWVWLAAGVAIVAASLLAGRRRRRAR